jgi:hypothetical protein
VIAAEFTVLADGTVMFVAIGADNVLPVTGTPTCFDDGLLANIFVIEVHRHCHEAVKTLEIYHGAMFFF